jgi:hypothetical protein
MRRTTSISTVVCAFAASLLFGMQGVPDSESDCGDSRTALRNRELAEQDTLQRLRLDELYLPQLDVSLPVLFKWSDAERIYLA